MTVAIALAGWILLSGLVGWGFSRFMRATRD